MRFVSAIATDFAVFFTAILGAHLLTRYLLDSAIYFSMDDMIENAIVAAIIAVGRAVMGKN